MVCSPAAVAGLKLTRWDKSLPNLMQERKARDDAGQDDADQFASNPQVNTAALGRQQKLNFWCKAAARPILYLQSPF